MCDKREILKKAMSKKYCGETRFDFLDPEERTMIYNAMEVYASLENKPQPKRKPLSDNSLPLTKEELEELTDMISIGMETVVLVEYVPNQFVWVTYSSGREERLSNIKAILWLAERFELTSNN